MTKDELSTKEKILQIAHKLFAEKGLNGVGIRELAKEADVNVSAINYHFGNKEKLYSETIKLSTAKTANDIKALYLNLKDKSDINELVIEIYDYFISNKEDLITGFKLFLTSDDNSYDFFEKDNIIGPPGGEIIYECLYKCVPGANENDLIWAVRTIFTHVLHKSMLVCNHSKAINQQFGLGPEGLKEDILRLTKIVIQEVQQSC